MRPLIALILASLPLFCLAGEERPRFCETLNLYLENDLFGETDRYYTNGIRFSCNSPDLTSYLEDPSLPGWVRSTNRRLRFFHGLKDEEELQRNLVVSFGQLMFTPTDKEARELLEDDRPYAGFLYLGFAYHVRDEEQLDSLELNVGMVGPASLAEEGQDFIHEIRDIDKFNGWDNQLENELGLQLVYEHKQRFKLSDHWPHQDFIAHSGVSLGNVATYLNFGGEYRIGWRLPQDFGTASLRPGGDNSAPGRGDARYCQRWICGLHAFVSVDTRLVARDIFLDGNTFEDSHSVDRRPVVADAAIGFSFLVDGWKISYAKVFRTREFEEQEDPHQYGSLSISYSF
ncbi:MAG: lipid A deacylase LpxR family protein [Porticoccaceae bacterium]